MRKKNQVYFVYPHSSKNQPFVMSRKKHISLRTCVGHTLTAVCVSYQTYKGFDKVSVTAGNCKLVFLLKAVNTRLSRLRLWEKKKQKGFLGTIDHGWVCILCCQTKKNTALLFAHLSLGRIIIWCPKKIEEKGTSQHEPSSWVFTCTKKEKTVAGP